MYRFNKVFDLCSYISESVLRFFRWGCTFCLLLPIVIIFGRASLLTRRGRSLELRRFSIFLFCFCSRWELISFPCGCFFFCLFLIVSCIFIGHGSIVSIIVAEAIVPVYLLEL
jgi:hypothetical protein